MGISTGTTSASAVATEPMVPALVRTAPVLTPKPLGSAWAGSCPSGRPQRDTCSLSWRNSIARNPAAVSAKTHQETLPPTRLTGTL
ncbi:hypothetical protein BJZ21_001548 [Nocardioides panaciterrulae]|uniref:Uncharacterized protein n=1 Tax=Nocardioides panaciterrulae TaxID=661492 RepID=A0A7Y9E5T0_9ACTN|nr:hypothetical protein [Nocardioides panaciterrulae]NYD41465.1 hypothetical protein [Nocardioides panaciterrulae]